MTLVLHDAQGISARGPGDLDLKATVAWEPVSRASFILYPMPLVWEGEEFVSTPNYGLKHK